MQPELIKAYRAERAPLHVLARDTGGMVECRERASQALRSARIKLAWKAAGGEVIDEYEAKARRFEDEPYGRVRLVLRPDDHSPPDDFDGSERDLQEARQRADRDGMWGVESQYFDGSQWVDVDSVWGFIGDDWKGSGYDVDLMASALDALAEHYAKQARDLEESRPDMYSLH